MNAELADLNDPFIRAILTEHSQFFQPVSTIEIARFC